MTTYYHGGPAGRRHGDRLLPPADTGALSLSEYGAAGIHRKDRVYLTTAYAAALLYACAWPDGVVYQCQPVGDLEPDPDCTEDGLSWQCGSARVVEVIKPSGKEMKRAKKALGVPV